MTTTEQRLADALRAILPFAERDVGELAYLACDDDSEDEAMDANADVERAREALATYDAQQAWSEQDASAASVEGWCVSDTSDGFAEIQRIDETEVFGEDAQAIAHVYWMAGTGSEVHKRAIAYTLRDGNTWPYTQASIAARAERSAHIRLCVNAHDALVSALQACQRVLDDNGGTTPQQWIDAEAAARAALAAAGVTP